MQITKQTARQMSRSARGVNDYVFVTFISSLFSRTAFFFFFAGRFMCLYRLTGNAKNQPGGFVWLRWRLSGSSNCSCVR